ncbi:MAG TPA: hypothetical protein VG944_01610 [Fimbriimonas sp.]|nr:hypothetical protein [Fimbriimonas sp.]
MDSKNELISWDEAEQVVRLHREQIGLAPTVTVSALSTALGIEPDRTRSLLSSVRSPVRKVRRVFIDQGGLLRSAMAASLVLGAGIWSYVAHTAPSKTPAISAQGPVGQPRLAAFRGTADSSTRLRSKAEEQL